MIRILKSIFPAEFFSNATHFRALCLAVLYVGTLLAQLFTFESFHEVIAAYKLPGGDVATAIFTWLIPLLAVASLPFLLSMKLGDRVYVASRTAVVALPMFWAGIGFWLELARYGSGVNSGLFGATMVVSAGLWLIVFAVLWMWAALVIVRELPRR